MKNKMEQNSKIEVVCWRFTEQLEKIKPDSARPILPIIKCVAGFITKENKRNLEISSTKGTRGFIDTVKIPKSSIISRNEISIGKN